MWPQKMWFTCWMALESKQYDRCFFLLLFVVFSSFLNFSCAVDVAAVLMLMLLLLLVSLMLLLLLLLLP